MTLAEKIKGILIIILLTIAIFVAIVLFQLPSKDQCINSITKTYIPHCITTTKSKLKEIVRINADGTIEQNI